MPDQPSKESLKLATAFFIGYFGNDAEKYHPFGIETLAFVFDAKAKDLRQKNAAMMSALRLAKGWILHGMPVSARYPRGRALPEIEKALTPYAPAEAEAKEKP